MSEKESATQRGVYRDTDGHLKTAFINADGQREVFDITDYIKAIALDAVTLHQKDYHGGFG